MDGNFACYEWHGIDGLLNQRVCKLIADERYIDRRFLLFGINGYLKAIQDATSSVTVGHLSSLDIMRIPFPLPPLPEQRRIVAKLEQVLARVDACRARLEQVPTLLKRYRQSVLAAACSGRLTEDWRGSSNLENGELPIGWDWVDGHKVFSFVTSGSRGWARYYSDEGALFIRMGNLSHETTVLDLRKLQYVLSPKGAEGTRTQVQPNDILVSITADVGMIGLVPSQLGEAYINQHVALARPLTGVNAQYVAWFLSCSEGGLQQLVGLQRGATKVGLGLDDIRAVRIPLPPRGEQDEIVRRVTALFAFTDQVEARYTQAKAHVDRLSQSILAKAFRGELVPQDPADEPASALLARIKQERPKTSTRTTGESVIPMIIFRLNIRRRPEHVNSNRTFVPHRCR